MIEPLELFEEVLQGFGNHPKWLDSRFAKIKTISNSLVGNVGQDYIEKLCSAYNLPYEFPKNEKTGERLIKNSWDIKIDNITYELKTATEDVGGKFQFNHLRYHREYEALLCLGVSPNRLYFGCWTKAAVATGLAGKLVSMEKSANASYKLTKSAAELLSIENFAEEIQRFTTGFRAKESLGF